MNVFLTGSTGLVGSAIRKKLFRCSNLYELRRVSDLDLSIPNKRILNVDLEDKEEVKQLVLKYNPEVIVHCAAIIPSNLNPDSPDLANKNAKIDDSIISATEHIGCRLIYMSSTIVYGNPDFELNINEDHSLNKNSAYAAQKIDAENRILTKINNGIILRLNAPYGLNMRVQTVISLFTKLALNNEPIEIYGGGSRMQDFTNTLDIAGLVKTLVVNKSKVHGVFNISAGEPISMENLAKKIVQIANSRSEIKRAYQHDAQENFKASFSIERAKKELNWNPKVKIEKGIKQLISEHLRN